MAIFGTRKSTSITPHGDFSDKQRWWSIRVMYLTMFLSSVTFTLTISSIWPFLQVLDSNATTDFLGWVVASYSVGQLVASPLFGMWANYRGKTREPLAFSITLGIAANLMYAYLESIPGNKGLYMIVARGVIGFAAGNVAVVRSYVAGATTVKERTPAMANVSISQSMGFILGPVIQAALVPLSYPGPIHQPGFHLNMYTAPAIFGSTLCVVNIVLLFTIFKEYRVAEEINIVSIQSSYEESVKMYKPDYYAIIYVICIFFVVLFIFTVFETIGTPLSMDMFAWTKKESTLYIGITLAVCGAEAIGVFVGLKFLSRRFNERYLLIFGFVFCFFGFFVQLPWGNGKLIIASTALDGSAGTISPTPSFISVRERSIDDDSLYGMVSDTIGTLLSHIKNIVNSDVIGNATDLTLNTSVTNTALTTTESMTSDLTSSLSTANWLTTTVSLTDMFSTSETTADIISTTVTDYSSTVTDYSSTVLTTDSPITDVILSTAASMSTSPKTTAEILSTFSTAPNVTVESVGCPATLDWCLTSPPVYLWQYLSGCAIISIGYPTASVMSYTLFSKILGPKPQGTWMGWLTASGSLARTLGPIFVSQIYNLFGPRVTMASNSAIIFVTIIAIIVVFRRLVPCKYTVDYVQENGEP